MAVLFSAVTLTADNNQVEFLAAGVPRDADDLEGWTAYACLRAEHVVPNFFPILAGLPAFCPYSCS